MPRPSILSSGAILLAGMFSSTIALAERVSCPATAAMSDGSTPALSSTSNLIGRYTTGPYYEISCLYNVTATTSAEKKKGCAAEIEVKTNGHTPSGWRAYSVMADFVSFQAGAGGRSGTCYYQNSSARMYRITFAQASYTCTPTGSSKRNRTYTCTEE